MCRTGLLALGAAVVLAGCVGPIADTTPTATPYPDEVVPFPDGPKDRPELPAELPDDTAREYAVAHEYRYSYNELWTPENSVGLSEHSCGVDDHESTGGGHLVTVTCRGYVNEPAGGDNATATVHADLAPWTVRYYIDGDSIVRTELD